MDNMHVSEWETIMVNLIATIFTQNNLEFNWLLAKTDLTWNPRFRKLHQNLLDYNVEVASKTVAKGVEYCVILDFFFKVHISNWKDESIAAELGTLGNVVSSYRWIKLYQFVLFIQSFL